MASIDSGTIELGSRTRARSVAAAILVGVAVLVFLLCTVAQGRWNEIHDAIDAVVPHVRAAAGPTAFSAPGTEIRVGSEDASGRTAVALTTVSQEVCFFAWATYAPLSSKVEFHDGIGGSMVLDAKASEAPQQALDACHGFGRGKSAVFSMLR